VGPYSNAWPRSSAATSRTTPSASQLNVPIRNRQAQADYIRDQLTLRQSQISQQTQINSVRVNVKNAYTALEQARARYLRP